MDLTLKELPILYKKTSTGAIQMWQVLYGKADEGFGFVKTMYGQRDGKIQETLDLVKEGKNIGKKTETTPVQQAALQAKQIWDKKIKSGYSENIADIENDVEHLPSIDPMLAHDYEDHKHKVTYPTIVQHKFDGLRCIAVVKGGKCRLYSRTRKEFKTVPHINEHVEDLCRINNMPDVMFDGELYSHEYRDNFEDIASLIKRGEVHPDVGVIDYFIYDLPSQHNVNYEGRFLTLKTIFAGKNGHRNLVRVPSFNIKNVDELKPKHDKFVADGYEGLMVRDPDAPYYFKRTHALLKYKVFRDEEFVIVGVKEGKGKLMGSAGSFLCLTEEGKEFSAKMEGELDRLKEYFVNFDKYKGKKLTVRYFRRTKYNVPRFPVGVRIREEE